MGLEGDRVMPRFERGCRGFAVLENDSLVAYGWLSTKPEWVGELGFEIAPEKDEAYVWNCLTLPEHRRRGHYRGLLDGFVALARAEGLSRLWIGSVESPAEKANRDVGFQPVINVTVRRIGRLAWLHASNDKFADPVLVAAVRKRVTARKRSRLSWIPRVVH